MPKFSAYMRGEGVKGDTGKNASFNEISATSHISNFPEVTISTSGPDDQKNINFDFGFVSGPSGGFSTNQNANIQFTEVGSLPSVSITTDDASPNNSKVFNFDFKIPEPKNIINIEQTILSTTSEGENEITISYNDNSSTTFIVHNGAQGIPSFIQGAVSTTLELPDNNNYTGQAFLVGDDEENKKLYVYLENEWKYQGSISGAGFGEPTGSIEMVSFTTSKIYTGDKILKLEKTEENNLEIESAKIYLQPIQDLHGYNNPWPAGGGKNVLPITLTLLKSQNPSGTWSNNVYTYNGMTYTVTLNDDGYVAKININGTASASAPFVLSKTEIHNDWIGMICNGCPSTGSGSTYYLGGWNQTDNTGLGISDTGSGFTIPSNLEDKSWRLYIGITNGTNVPNKDFYPMIRSSSVTDATYAPYSNECPISGHSIATIPRTGKNLINIPQSPVTINGITFTPHEDGSITVNGTATNIADFVIVDYNTPINFGNITATFTIEVFGYNINTATLNFQNDFYDSSTYLGTVQAGNNAKTKTFSGINLYLKSSRIRIKSGQTFSNLVIKPMMVIGSTTPTEFAPYQGQTVIIDLDGTRYGGTVDALTGVMTVDRTMVLVKDVSGGWNKAGGGSTWIYSGQTSSALPYKFPPTNNQMLKISASMLPVCAFNSFGSYARAFAQSTSNLLIKDTDLGTAEEFLEVYGNMQLVLELATPFTVQLTPVELSLLLGENNIWTDAGILELNCSKINKPKIIVSVNPESPESAKIFDFDFKIPQGKPGEKGDTPIIGVSTSVTTLEHDVEPTVSITTLNENEFRFDFGIPVGYTPEMTAAISTTDLPSGSTASATVNVEQNNLNFHFGIPQGLKGETGASINGFTFSSTNPETHGNIYYANFTDGTSTLFEVPEGPMGYGYYQKLPFTSTNIEESNQYTWIEENNGSSTLIINRTENDFIPVNIYNSTNNNIAATFTLAASTENYPFGSIQYNTNEKFDGILYYIGKAPVPQLRIGSVTTSSDGVASISTNKDGYDTVLNFSFPLKGDKGDKGDKGEDGKDGADGKDGNGIASVEILSIEGLTTNYRITFTDETMTPFDFSVRNGRSGGNGEGGGGIDEVDLSDDSIIINTLPIKHGGTGATTSTQAWINLGGGESGKHPEDYYLKSTDAVIPTLDYTDSITSISTESYAGTTTFVARGDHVHNISLTTGDENGQVKIAGVNIDVKGLKSAAYTVTTNYYPSIGGNIPTMSVGGGERIDKISITNVDPGVGSQLANNNILFVYTGGGGYYTIVGDYTGDCLEYSNPHLCFTDDCPNDRCYNKPTSTNCFDYDPDCFKDCFDQNGSSESGSESKKVRIIYDNTYIIRRDGTLVRYGSANEVYEVIGDAVIRRQNYPWGGVEYPEEDGYYYQIGEDEYIFVKALDTGYTCPNNCFDPNCPTDDCFEGRDTGSCPNNCPANLPNPRCENNCFGGCYGNGCYGNCYGDDCFKVRCYGSCSNDGLCQYEICPSNSIGCARYVCSAFTCDKGGAPDQCPWFNCRNNLDTCFCAGYSCY